ncbi:hypothetical protein [Enterobacter chuandaensis]|uniref:hypothetical protein n=1 Tax=Enterobacter chuandaensis TaxID=2497875 RepID=UPI002FD1A779
MKYIVTFSVAIPAESMIFSFLRMRPDCQRNIVAQQYRQAHFEHRFYVDKPLSGNNQRQTLTGHYPEQHPPANVRLYIALKHWRNDGRKARYTHQI